MLHLDREASWVLRAAALLRWKDGKPLSPRTVQYAATLLSSALEHAVKMGLLELNPASHATKPRFAHDGGDPALAELQVWTAAEVRTFFDKVRGDLFEPVWVLAICTGMRRGELLGLRWEDTDLGERTIHVRRALSVVHGDARLKGTKSSRSRSIRIDERAHGVLTTRLAEQRRHRAKFNGGWQDEWGLVFTKADGAYIEPDRVSVHWRKLVRDIDVPVIRLHDLRHTHATLLLEAGVPIKVISERLGHAGIQFTLDSYMHVLPAMDRDAVERFARLIDGEDSDAARYGSVEGWQQMTLYLPDELRRQIERKATSDGAAVGDVIRTAIQNHLARDGD